jgi:GNAT superfamily N-acetyltransferase
VSEAISVRPARPGDAQPISTLLGELGYPAEPGDIPRRLDALAAYPAAVTLVATSGVDVCGVITGHLIPSIHSAEPVAWITSLVVSTDFRSMGIGSLLVAEIERWASENGALRVSVTSGAARERAHHFYERLGFDRSGVRFTRHLPRE